MNPFRWTALFNSLLVALALVVGGCATSPRRTDRAPPVQIPESTWWQVDNDIGAASLAAKGIARGYARDAMEGWRDSIRQRTETNFIPWFTGYWTQQRLSARVAWYKANAGEDRDAALKRLSIYLHEKFRARVLNPVAKEIDPNAVRRRSTALYVRSLGERIPGIRRRYGVPEDQFDRRLKAIPAIAVPPSPNQGASLYQVVHAAPLANLPAYEALMSQMSKEAGPSGTGAGDDKISPLAEWTGDRLGDRFAISGGASVAAAVFGGVAGMMLSLGATGFGVMAHENERAKVETQLRGHLDSALDKLWYEVLEDPSIGVLAGVYSISEKIEDRLPSARTQPVTSQPQPRQIPLPGE